MSSTETKERASQTTEPPARPELRQEEVRPRRDILFGRSIGISVTADGISLATARHWGPYRTVKSLRTVQWDSDSNTERRRQSAFEAFESFVAEHGTPDRIVVAIAGNDTAFRTLMLPVLKRHDLEKAVRIEAAKQLPFPAADARLDFQPTRKISSGDRARYQVTVHAATKRRVHESMQPCERRVNRVGAVYSSHALVGELLRRLPDFRDDRSYTVLQLGRESTEIAFYRGGIPEFCHVTGTGASMLGNSPDTNRLEFFAETLSSEIQTSFDYYAGHHTAPADPVVFVHGILAEHEALCSELAARVGYRFVPFPVEQIPKLSARFTASHIRATLPAIAAALNRTKLPNLLPPALKERVQLRRVDRIGRVAIIGLLLLMVAGWVLMNRDLQVMRERSMLLSHQVDMYRSSPAYQTYVLLQDHLAQAQRYVAATEKQPTYLALNLKELSHLTPADLRLTRLDFSPGQAAGNLRMHGVVTSEEIPPEMVLAEFVERLKASPFYSNVIVERHVKQLVDTKFQLSFQLLLDGVL